jgi:hypothetical protein
MTRKDFELIAATIKAQRCANLFATADAIDALAFDFADRLKGTNQQFNRDRFLRACGCAKLHA